ncbi:MAG: CpsB/CapC family capsule biosynthesis tyrosine phosphatase [Oscillospiraceae bacterium]|nr:CpsB/CapC family capsule biosynthesis tyrosine phosphatase [Oscillospiraceae bacterium]
MKADFHSHILPCFDDGVINTAQTAKYIALLKKNGITHIYSTSHYIPHREPVDDFICRRKEAYAKLVSELESDGKSIPEIRLGAEVHMEKGISQNDKLPLLCIEGTNVILLELPYREYEPWMLEEIYNIVFKFKIHPLIAHLNRYFSIYNDSQLSQILSVKNAVYQFNLEAFESRSSSRRIIRLISGGLPAVFGTDYHGDMDELGDFFINFERRTKKKDIADMTESTEQKVLEGML